MEAGAWAAGGASVDSSGNVFVSTGNSNQTSSSDPYDQSDGVIKLAAEQPGAPGLLRPERGDRRQPRRWSNLVAGQRERRRSRVDDSFAAAGKPRVSGRQERHGLPARQHQPRARQRWHRLAPGLLGDERCRLRKPGVQPGRRRRDRVRGMQRRVAGGADRPGRQRLLAGVAQHQPGIQQTSDRRRWRSLVGEQQWGHALPVRRDQRHASWRAIRSAAATTSRHRRHPTG